MSPDHHILYISYDGMTDQLGQSQVLPYLSGLSAKGYAITLLSCEKPENYDKNKEVIAGLCSKAGINWQPISYTATPPVLSTIKDIIALGRRARELHRQYQFSIVHCRSYISALVGLSMKRKYGTRFLFDMRGFWADERVDGGLWNLGNPLYGLIYKYFKRKEKTFLEEADHIISLTNAAKKEMQGWSQIQHQPLPVTVIPCCVDTELFDPGKVQATEKAALRARLGVSEDQMIVGYIGSIGTWYMLDEMLLYYHTFRRQHANSRMLFVTNEPKEMIVTRAAGLGIEAAALIITAASRKEVPVLISILHHGLFFIKPCFSKIASSPTKQGEIMAMGIPVVCNAGVGDTEDVVSRYKAGVVIHAFTEEAYQSAGNEAAGSSFDPGAIRAGAVSFYGLEKGIAAYDGIYASLIKTVQR